MGRELEAEEEGWTDELDVLLLAAVVVAGVGGGAVTRGGEIVCCKMLTPSALSNAGT